MALDLTGIGNVNEFYSHHYLDALLESDLKGLLSRWEQAEKEESRVPPYKALSRCSEEYFKAKGRATTTATDEDRFTETHAINVKLTEALGYPYQSGEYELIEDDQAVPVLASLKRDGNPYIWLVEAPWADEDQEPLKQRLVQEQKSKSGAFRDGHKFPFEVWEDLLSLIFRREQPPRWVMLLAGNLIFLAERHKWGQGKYLLFDVDELLGRKQADALKATAALLSRDALCPEDGTVLHDTLDENSHKHAFAVSGDLKYGLRRAVELLANEFIWYRENTSKKKLYGDDDLARKLTVESLTYLYRLLFLFYAEARGEEVGVLPMKSDEYREGYSLESLRDLEQVPLTTEAAQDGYFIDQSLRMLFKLVNDGFQPDQRELVFEEKQPDWWLPPPPVQKRLEFAAGTQTTNPGAGAVLEELGPADFPAVQYLDHGFTITGLESPLFDLKRTPLLSSVRFRNVVLQEVIQLLSLSREGGKGNKRKERGRISYAELGINQLGAVYEGLLSYTGFFAQERLYEVKPAGAAPTDETQQSYFVPESEITKYNDDELVYEEVEGAEKAEQRRKKYEKGMFIFRLAGRDRQKSASYYTPECLTQCVVKYALKELLKDKTADEILKLTVCEPAMGSGAFLNEAINQLADAYLERKQKELGQTISPGYYPVERQRVKAYLATHNCYGVDLNPVATELAKVSLWLNTIYPGSRCPWFGLRLAVGNSLIGARRQVFGGGDLKRKKTRDRPNWLGLVPEHVPLGPTWQARPEDTVYHFLVPDEGMAAFDTDKVIKGLAKNHVASIKAWRKEFCKPFDRDEVAKLVELSDAVDDLWKQVVRERHRATQKTSQPIEVWAQDKRHEPSMSIQNQEKVAAELERYYTAYRRLKLTMDYWCALWFWPITESGYLPTRDQFLLDLELILKGTISTSKPEDVLQTLFPNQEISEDHTRFVSRFGVVDVDELCRKIHRLEIVSAVAEQIRFHHWELRFAEVLANRGGFDLIIGNPPWVKVEWNEGGILSDIEPLSALRELSATEIANRRGHLLTTPDRQAAYFGEFVEQEGAKRYLNSLQNFPMLQGVQTNLYKCFVTRGWDVGSNIGVIGFVHPEGTYDDPKGGGLRSEIYQRLRGHYQFQNVFTLFDINDHGKARFGIHLYLAKPQSHISFVSCSNLFHPLTLDQSIKHDGHGSVPGIKNDDNEWDTRPHRHRLLQVNRERLALFSRMYDPADTPAEQARLPVIHSDAIVTVLEKFARQDQKLADLRDLFFSTVMFDETHAQQEGILQKKTEYPRTLDEWIVSGPHFFVGTPLNKTPNENCLHNQDYSDIDLVSISDDYLPRTNFVPACPIHEYSKRVPIWNDCPVTDYHRVVARTMIVPTNERTLITAVLPPGPGHIDGCFSLSFLNPETAFEFGWLCASLPFDFFVKTTGKTHFRRDLAALLPIPKASNITAFAFSRIMSLTCVVRAYAATWNLVTGTCPVQSVHFVKTEPRLQDPNWSVSWNRSVALRTHYARRQALVELDALAALALDLTEEELVTIYRVQFPVLRQYEREDLYDQTGRLVPKGVLDLAKQHNIDFHQPLNVCSFTGPAELVNVVETPGMGVTGGIVWEDPKMEPRMSRVYPPPFTKCDREADMRQAYRVFQERLRGQEKRP